MLQLDANATPAPPWSIDSWVQGTRTPLSLESLRGKVIVMHAFQMLCPGCVTHGLPQAARVMKSFDPRDVQVIGLHAVFEHHDSMRPDALRAFMHEWRIPFPVGVDTPGESDIPMTMARYEMRGTPTLVLIDREGRRRAQVFGRPEDMEVGAAIQALIDESPRGGGVDGATDKGDDAARAGCDDEGCAIPGG